MPKKNTESQVPVLRKPDPVPEWIPSTSEDLAINDIIREMSVIGFDRDQRPETRLKALVELAKHKGMYIERSESRLIDSTQVEVAKEMFRQLTPDERRKWLEEHMARLKAEIPLHPDSPPDPPASRRTSTLEDLHGK